MIKNEQSSDQHQIIKYYNNFPVVFTVRKDKTLISGKAIAEELSLNPKTIINIYNRYKQELEPYSSVIEIMTKKGLRATRFYDEIGFIGICFLSGFKEGEPFRIWALNVLKEISEKGSYIQKKGGVIDMIVHKLHQTPNLMVSEIFSELNVSKTTVYAYFKKLQERELIDFTILKNSKSGRPSKIYHLTKKAKDMFNYS